MACQLADVILLDTQSHIQYFVEAFRLQESKFRRVWIGADDDIMQPSTFREVRRSVFFFQVRLFLYMELSTLFMQRGSLSKEERLYDLISLVLVKHFKR